MAQAALAQPPIDENRLEAAHLAMSALHVYERHNAKDTRPRMALATAFDFGKGRLDVMADKHALELCRLWADKSAKAAGNPQARAAALAVAAACESTVNIEAVQRLVSAALE